MKTAPLFSAEEIQAQTARMALEISAFYGSKEVLAIAVLTGAFVFYSDLLRRLSIPVECDFCSVSFYKGEAHAAKEARLVLDIKAPLRRKHVLLIDCIADNGLSLSFLKSHIQKREPLSLKSAALIAKPEAEKACKPDWIGFKVPQDVFVVGYGVDYRHEGRAFPDFRQVSDIN